MTGAQFRAAAKVAHPDHGGSHEAMCQLVQDWWKARTFCTGPCQVTFRVRASGHWWAVVNHHGGPFVRVRRMIRESGARLLGRERYEIKTLLRTDIEDSVVLLKGHRYRLSRIR